MLFSVYFLSNSTLEVVYYLQPRLYFMYAMLYSVLPDGTLGLPCSGDTLEEDCMDINMECDMGLCECQPDFTFNYLQQKCEPGM